MRPWVMRGCRLWVAASCLVLGCSGEIGERNDVDPVLPRDDVPDPLPSGETLAPTGASRLSALEVDRALAVLLEDESRPSRLLLPEDARTPFDNDYEAQEPSGPLVEGVELLAREAVERLMADPERRDRVLGCTPTAAGDEACLETIVRGLGRRVLRRAITDDDVAFFVGGGGEWPGAAAIAVAADDFYAGAGALLSALLQDPEFLYRIEIGTPYDDAGEGVFRLSEYEIATRLSFFLWGSVPDEALLDRAAAGELSDPATRVAEALRMLEHPLARERLALVHAMWFGYEKLVPGSELGLAMREETQALFDRLLFDEGGAWQELFRTDQTWVTPLLAEHYGLADPGPEGGLARYAMAERRGLFAHGSFLSIGFKDGDTSPVMRGLAIQRNAFCQVILPAPPGVNTDEGPESDALCKPERYAAHSSGGCASCHTRIDPVGFGLEAFDATGAFRAFETDDPRTPGDESTCAIEGEGHLAGVGDFSGPAGLAELGLESGLLRSCFATHIHRLIIGRGALRRVDHVAAAELDERLPEGDFTLEDVVRTVVENETFVVRREDTP